MNYVECQRCHQAKATVHITEIAPDKVEHHLCEECAEKEGVIIKQHHAANAMLQEFLKQKGGGGDDRVCPKCGITFREFQMSGQLGCPHDYEAFRSLLTPLIERAHEDADRHTGKVPSTSDATIRRQTGLLQLRRQLQEAVDAENYEQAARVRDEIRILESSESVES